MYFEGKLTIGTVVVGLALYIIVAISSVVSNIAGKSDKIECYDKMLLKTFKQGKIVDITTCGDKR